MSHGWIDGRRRAICDRDIDAGREQCFRVPIAPHFPHTVAPRNRRGLVISFESDAFVVEIGMWKERVLQIRPSASKNVGKLTLAMHRSETHNIPFEPFSNICSYWGRISFQ